MIDSLDKWAAEQCGVYTTNYAEQSVHNVAASWVYYDSDGNCISVLSPWTLSDPRCMQVFRERFRVDTTWTTNNDWYCFVELGKDDYLVEERGKTIAEAEMAGAKAIYEAMKDK